MNNKQVGLFIKELRKEKGLSQYELADKLMIPRVSISKWERGIMGITSNNLKLLSEFFGVTTDELMAGERNKKGLSEKVNDITLSILDNNIKLHKIIKYTVAIIVILAVSFLVYYFYTFYNSVKIYSIHIDSDKYIAKYGQLTKTSDKIYFYLDIDYLIEDIEDIESVQLFYINGNKLVTLGEMEEIKPFSFTSTKGYDEFMRFDDFDVAIKHMYIYVNFKDGDFERLTVDFDREYSNTKLLPKSDKEVINHSTTKYKRKESTIFYERFNKLKVVIDEHGKDGMMDFKFEGKKYHLEIMDDELNICSSKDKVKIKFKYSYYNKELFYLNFFDENNVEKQKYCFDIQKGKCLEGDCTNHMDNYREMLRLYYEIMYEY